MKKIIIDPEIRDLLPPRSDDESTRLSEAIQLDGCREPLVVWQGHGILLDGHGRYEVCQEHKIKFETVAIGLPDRNAAIEWVVNNQLAKRNLTDERRAYYIGKQYLAQKQKDSTGNLPSGQNVRLAENTAKKIAEQHGVSERTVRRSSVFAQKVDEQPEPAKEAILSGKSGTKKNEVINAPPGKLFCDRCSRVGVNPKCTRCAEVRKEAKKPAREPGVEETKKRKAAGRVKFDWRQFDDAFGILMRQIDRVGNEYGDKEGPQADALRKQLAQFRKDFAAWYRKSAGLEKGK